MYDNKFHRKMQLLNREVIAGTITREKLVDKLRKYLMRRSKNDPEYMSLDTREYVSNIFDDSLEYREINPLSMFELSKDPSLFHSSHD